MRAHMTQTEAQRPRQTEAEPVSPSYDDAPQELPMWASALTPVGPAPVVQRQAAENPSPEPSLPPVRVPGTELTLIPGPLSSSVFDTRIPLPASLRLTNALGAGAGPSFLLDLSPRVLSLYLLNNLDLYTWTRSGTPPGAESVPENQARISLLNPVVTLNPTTRELRGIATLSVGSDYPTHIKGPSEVSVDIRSSELGRFTGNLGYGPLSADFSLRLHYDTARLEQALSPVFAPQGGARGLWDRFQTILRQAVPADRLRSLSETLQTLWNSLLSGDTQTAAFVVRTVELIRSSVPPDADLDSLRAALRQLAEEVTHPGFTLGGRVSLFGLPISGFSATAPTTVPLQRPLLGAPTAFPLTYSAYGTIIAPAGSLFDVAAPALGYTRSSFGETSGTTFTAATLPTLSPEAISGGQPPVNWFPVYAYLEFSHVRRVNQNLDLGVRVIVQTSTPELFGGRGAGPSSPTERLNQMISDYQSAQGEGAGATPVTPNVGVTIYGRFSGL